MHAAYARWTAAFFVGETADCVQGLLGLVPLRDAHAKTLNGSAFLPHTRKLIFVC